VLLNPLEIAVLEVVRDFDRYSEVTWPEARKRLRRLAGNGRVDLGTLADVAADEHRAGLRERLADLVNA
jgi:hypothetical protein